MNEDGDKSDNLAKDNCESPEDKCETPTVSRCTEIPVSEKEQKGEIKQTTVDSVLHSEAICGTGETVKSASFQNGNDASKEDRSYTFEVRLSGPSEGETGKSRQSFPSGQDCKITTVYFFCVCFRLRCLIDGYFLVLIVFFVFLILN